MLQIGCFSAERSHRSSLLFYHGSKLLSHFISFFQVREDRQKDAAKFSELHARLQRSTLIKNREALLTLFLSLSERPSPAEAARKLKAPFVPLPLSGRRGNAAEEGGGAGGSRAQVRGRTGKEVVRNFQINLVIFKSNRKTSPLRDTLRGEIMTI